ncbi:methylated-DNA--[protein]-cysteine S-methyltransferase [Pedobacter heparinus]|uniref:Methylated-DNA--protein-cysteine methyltransferase n=1 Tax=Pedobacter heparinus (strain ATCC 13125 / DSM 2366 / CIP 104194 / JCM 7457 / NBRC 12017 / NCIMB 9290 / NRRL B-14731 / HIM 762-3) TaxID=485917 RepID=C6Y210_PEDHD|nr:methylated-DNA--[protein]-cysteine S-methyltransferase [Pedobacter heparinus]ACU03003.1 methylated-DNA/protein-cysteine methyltransferase [Pedobacter heparinus DSM 2366]
MKEKKPMKYYHKIIKSPVGELKLVASDQGLAAVLWENDDPKRVPIGDSTASSNNLILQEAEKQLNEYFEKKRTVFTVKLDFSGTPFQKKVWEALLNIPFGETRTYGEIARELGDIKAVRAVGAANGKNPISIIAPCHRVIGASGKLTGFAGGLDNKARLLQMEDSRKNPTLW